MSTYSVCYSLSALIWKKHMRRLTCIIPDILVNNLKGELLTYQLIEYTINCKLEENYDKKRDSGIRQLVYFEYGHNYVDQGTLILNKEHYQIINPWNFDILIKHSPIMKRHFLDELTSNLKSCLIWKNCGLLMSILNLDPKRCIENVKENYHNYLSISVANNDIESFEFLINLCNKRNLEIDKCHPVVNLHSNGKFNTNLDYLFRDNINGYGHHLRKVNEIVALAIVNDNVEFLKILEKNGFDIKNDVIEESCRNQLKHNCLNYIYEIKGKMYGLREEPLFVTDRYYAEDGYNEEKLREDLYASLLEMRCDIND